MVSPTTSLPLNTGASIPALGLGTWQSATGEVKKAVFHAIKSGYRHIGNTFIAPLHFHFWLTTQTDAAFVYGNETEVGAGIKEAIDAGIVKREDLFVTTKLWCTYHTRVEEGLTQSLSNLGLKYVDLYLMHWPIPMNPKGM